MPDKPFPQWLQTRILGLERLCHLSMDDFTLEYDAPGVPDYYPFRLQIVRQVIETLIRDLREAGYLPYREA